VLLGNKFIHDSNLNNLRREKTGEERRGKRRYERNKQD
jgi:hypothetical protein